MNKHKQLIFSIIMIFSLLAVGVASFLVIELTKKPGAAVSVSLDGETVAEYPLSEDGEYPIPGVKNVLVIEGGAVYMKNADCPDKLCIHQGKISHTGERIVCLPNKVMAEILGTGDEIFIN